MVVTGIIIATYECFCVRTKNLTLSVITPFLSTNAGYSNHLVECLYDGYPYRWLNQLVSQKVILFVFLSVNIMYPFF